jgi:hypothetical protein
MTSPLLLVVQLALNLFEQALLPSRAQILFLVHDAARALASLI